jgi:hypothetical protein
MDTIKVATIIEALDLIGAIYRNKDGSQPADAVKKIQQQLSGGLEMTLGEWAAARKAASNGRAARGRAGKAAGATRSRVHAKAAAVTAEEAAARLDGVATQAQLRETISGLGLTAPGWKELARRFTGRSAASGKAAREAIETHFSDRLLLDERVESVKRQFG